MCFLIYASESKAYTHLFNKLITVIDSFIKNSQSYKNTDCYPACTTWYELLATIDSNSVPSQQSVCYLSFRIPELFRLLTTHTINLLRQTNITLAPMIELFEFPADCPATSRQ